MFRRVAYAGVLIAVVVASGFWLQARLGGRCPDVGNATSVDATVTARDGWRSADLTLNGLKYGLEPEVMADFGAYVRPVPLPESHHVGVIITIQAFDLDAVAGWKTTCLRLIPEGGSVSRPATAARVISTGG